MGTAISNATCRCHSQLEADGNPPAGEVDHQLTVW